jgi:hypothetical protein
MVIDADSAKQSTQGYTPECDRRVCQPVCGEGLRGPLGSCQSQSEIPGGHRSMWEDTEACQN